MKIGLVTDCYRPTKNGVVTAVALLKTGLERRGHQVILLTADYPGSLPPEPGVVRFPSVSFNRSIELRLPVIIPRTVRPIIERERLDVIHTHTEFTLACAARAAAEHLNIPLVHTAHTLWHDYRHYLFFGRWLSPALIRQGFARFLRPYQAVICPSDKMRCYLAGCIPPDKIAVIPNGVCPDRFRPDVLTLDERKSARRALGLSAADRVLLIVGRLGQEKRVEALLRALIPLLREHPTYKTLWGGGGPAARALVGMAARHGVGDQVILLGYIPWEDMPRVYNIADAYVTASLSEVHPITLIEAAMCGLPIIARRDEGCTDLVQDGRNGWLVESDDQIAVRAAELLTDEARRAAFARHSVEVAHGYSADEHVKRVLALYQQVSEGNAPDLQTKHPRG
jgi:1,2-diacylglycerol 3-alpha-glucosyltransferase